MSKVRYCPQLNVPAVLAMSNHHYPPLTTTIAALISSTAGYQCKKEPSSSANRGQNTLHETNSLFLRISLLLMTVVTYIAFVLVENVQILYKL